MGPFCEGVIGPLLQRSGRPFCEALDQPITTPGRLDPSSTLGVHNWWAILLYHNRGTKWLANSNSTFVILNCFVLFNFVRGAAKLEGRTTYPLEWNCPPTNGNIWTTWAQAGILIRKCKKTIMNLLFKQARVCNKLRPLCHELLSGIRE